MLPHQISLDFFKQCHTNNLHILPKELKNYLQIFWYDKYNKKIARQECLICQITPQLHPKPFKRGERSFERSIRPKETLMINHISSQNTQCPLINRGCCQLYITLCSRESSARHKMKHNATMGP